MPSRLRSDRCARLRLGWDGIVREALACARKSESFQGLRGHEVALLARCVLAVAGGAATEAASPPEARELATGADVAPSGASRSKALPREDRSGKLRVPLVSSSDNTREVICLARNEGLFIRVFSRNFSAFCGEVPE